MKSNNMSSLEKILEEITPKEQHRTDVRMQLAAAIADAMEEKGWNKKKLMEAMGKKNPSEVTRWLSGTHNFTMDTLTDLGRVLNRRFINTDHPEIQQIKKFNISTFAFSGSNENSAPYSDDLNNLSTSQKQGEFVLYNIECNECN